MRVLFVNRMASMVRGGGETFDLEISRHLQLLGCDVQFLSGIPVFGRAQTPVTHAPSATLRTPYTGGFRWDQVRGGWRLRLADFWMFETAAARWAVAHADEFDIVQVCELPTFVDAWKKAYMKQPVVMRLTAPDFHDAAGAVAKADAVIASGATLIKAQMRIHRECVNVPNGVDTELFRPQSSDFRAQHGLDPRAFVVLFVARFQGVKNHRMLVRAFSQLAERVPGSVLVLAGSGPLEADIRRLCEEPGLAGRVIFLGETPFAELPSVYAAADVMVISSDYESFCFAALEAMATALPLVVTDTDWVPRLIERDKGGRVVPRGNSEAMAGALIELAGNALLRRQMGAWNRDCVLARFGWESSARKLRDVYQGLLEARADSSNSISVG